MAPTIESAVPGREPADSQEMQTIAKHACARPGIDCEDRLRGTASFQTILGHQDIKMTRRK